MRQSGLSPRRVVALAVFLLTLATAAAGQEPASSVELLVESPGESAELEIFEDGQSVATASGEPVGEWRVTILFDQLLSSPRLVKTAALDLAALAPLLVELGPVEVVTAGAEGVARSLPATREARGLEEALEWMSVREGGADEQLEARRRFLSSPPMVALAEGEYSAVSATAGRRVAELTEAARQALAEEVAALERQRSVILGWLADESEAGAQLLVLVSGGWDEATRDFYRDVLRRAKIREVGESLPVSAPQPSLDLMARSFSALGWVTLTYSPSRLLDPEILAGRVEGIESPAGEESAPPETVIQDGEEVNRAMLGSVDPRDLFRRLGGEPLEARMLAGEEPLEVLAEATGGERLTEGRRMAESLGRLESRVRVVYPSPVTAPTEGWRRVEVRPPGAGRRQELRARRWVTTYPPRLLAALRAQGLVEEGVEEGELTVAVSLDEGAATLEVEVGAPAGASVPRGPLRATLAVAREDRAAEISHHLVASDDVRPIEDFEGAVAFTLPAELAADPGTPAMVLVEDLSGGLWGSGFVRVASRAGRASRPGTGSFLLPAPRVVTLLEPTEPVAMGPTTFDTVVSASRVSRVDFYLDGELAVSRDGQPFSARLDLGRLPRPRRVEAVAYAPDGGILGRDEITINEGTGSFRVRIVSPSATETGTADEPWVGNLEVEAELRVPGGSRLERLEFYWKEKLVGTRYAPPFVQRVTVPGSAPTGFLRVVGYLEDGSSAEDVVFVNSPAGSESLRVELVELYTVVTDRQGRPIRGLAQDDFRVLEGGVEQEIATFDDAGERPLTVGLAIDSSASMFVKLPDVQAAASSFLTGLESRRDRAFVVGFGDEPFLQRDTTSDLSAVRNALASLKPAGRTSIWKGIVYSLVQLQGVPGKKALIVFSDGADEDPDFSYRTSLDFARRVGVPVYIVVSNDEIFRTEGRGLTIRGFMNRLETLTRAVGGRVFLTRVGEDLEAIYAEIDEELRSQYLLGYYVSDRDTEEWRPVEVEVSEPGVRARTISGYYQ